ncbi:flagellar biosynthetic protein FliR [Roseibium alexandrii]|uniref:Flagellar biosynthetic protein FliR n=1 Tax=Roseibium alexandrii (strain DSM 17067 / NCIMB 14079 / DFL-11) TaxID=244592 RepID=A0A5E8H0H5_ROSAD|nr:flagellar biosynthetic protein FliR [Roseibium alexandrii]EEE45407.1 flagellar biosynthetic protein FliR [Roseibium alexandrii DFL-11]
MTIELDFLPDVAAAFMLMFARLGTMIMLLPALGESSIPTRFRLTIALAMTLVLYPVGSQLYPADLVSNPAQLGVLLISEIVIGVAIGLCAKLVTSAVQIAGVIMANQSGLAFALGTDISNEGQQGALYGNFLALVGITLIFTTDTHYLVIAALHDSFTLFPPGSMPPVGDFSENFAETVAMVFSIAVRMSAPFLVVGLVFYFGLGLLNKLMPQMQIFFIAMPVNIAIGFFLLMVLISTLMMFYLEHVQQALGKFIAG